MVSTHHFRSALCLLLVFAMLLCTLCACGSVSPNSTDTSSTEGPAETSATSSASENLTDATTLPVSNDAPDVIVPSSEGDATEGPSPDTAAPGVEDANGSTSDDPNPSLDTDSETETEADEDSDIPACELPELDFGGQEFVFLSRYREGWTSGELTVEGLNSDPVNDAVYERNQVIEAQLHITIRNIEERTDDPEYVTNKLVTAVKSGIHEYDILAAPMYTMTNASLDGNFWNLLRSDYLDLEKPWWSQGLNEALEYKGLQYLVAGSALLSLYRFTFATMFNKDLFDKVGLPYLYENVRNNTWTLDYQNSIVELFYVDNGNNQKDETGDIYGFVSNDNISADPYWSSCAVTILGRDEEGGYTLDAFDLTRLEQVTQKVLQLYYGHGNATYDYKYRQYDGEQDLIRDMFSNGYAAMATLRILALESSVMQDMKDEYGIVPMPKYDEAQADYGTMVHDMFTTLAIPCTAPEDRFESICAVMESLAYHGHTIVRPAYYDVALRTKLVTDPESSEMLDILFNHISIDPGILYSTSMASFHDAFRTLIKNNDNTVMSTFKAKTKEAEKVLKKQISKKLNNLAKKELE